MQRRVAITLSFALSCGGSAPSPEVIDVRTPAVLPAEPQPENLELRLSPRGRARFFPAIGVLHEAGERGGGRDFAIDAEGHPTRIDGDPFASRARTELVDVVGDWPHVAWARAVVEDADTADGSDDDGAEQVDRQRVRRLLEWDGSSWSEVPELGDMPISHPVGEPAPPTLPHAALLALAPWGRNDALAVRFEFAESRAPEGSARPWNERCSPARQTQLGGAVAPPELYVHRCLFAPHALATSPAADVFLLAQPRLGRPLRKELVAWGPIEVRRWTPGAREAARDDLASMIGFHPGILDAWERRTLLVESATDAYLAVTSPARGGAATARGLATAGGAVEGAVGQTLEGDEIVLLHFDGSRWSEVLRAPPPWGGMERASDGSIWLIVGSQLYAAPPSTSGSQARAFSPVATSPAHDGRAARTPGPAGDRGDRAPVVPLQVMPWSATRASVIARFGGELGLFTVVRSDDVPPPPARTSQPARAPARPGNAVATPGDAKTKPMQIRALDTDRQPIADRPYVMLAGGRRFEGRTAADGNVAVDIPIAADILELFVWQHPTLSEHWTFDVVDALPPIHTPAGVRVRLRNLGYVQGDDAPDLLDDALVQALRAFQAHEHIPATGVIDATTIDRLRALYGH